MQLFDELINILDCIEKMGVDTKPEIKPIRKNFKVQYH